MNEIRPDNSTFQTGDLVNNTYRIEDVLGRGGTSEVYKARSEISGRIVAMKVLRKEFASNDEYLTLLTREEQIRDVAHAAVVRYSENNRTADGLVYLVMDYVEGPDLAHRMKEGGMSSEALLSVARRVCEGLEAVHSQNIVHRDLSPDNIILRHGEPEEAVIIDFGIAKDTTEGAITIVGNEFAGKYAYAAPEQLHGNSDHRTDLYSLGMVLLAVYNGKPPFIGNNIKEMMEIKGRRPDTEGVPEDLKGLIDRLTEPDPAHRFQSAGEVLDYIWGDDDRPRPRYTQFPGAQPAPAPKGRGLIGALAAVVVVAAIGAGLFFSGVLEPLLRPSYPAVDPYTLAARKTPGGGVTITGHAPSEEAAAAIAAQGDQMGGDVDLVLAS
ncbi:MAG: serine/threonine-protein kinase, partial [Pseudomonadota bacterium]